jgi:hypothetical protein
MFQKQWNAYGYRVRFEWNDADFTSLVERVVLPDWSEDTVGPADAVFGVLRERRNISIEQNGETKSQNLSMESIIHSLKRFCHLEVATFVQDLVFVHAGVVLTEFGLLLLPGRSYAGKSTLVKSLIDAGGRYFSDEYAIVDKDGLVRPFPRDLCLRLPQGKEDFHPATSLGWNSAMAPQPVAAVMATHYEKNADWSARELSQGEAVLKLLENTVCARTEPQKAISFLATAVERSVCFEVTRGESPQAADIILQMMSKHCR